MDATDNEQSQYRQAKQIIFIRAYDQNQAFVCLWNFQCQHSHDIFLDNNILLFILM